MQPSIHGTEAIFRIAEPRAGLVAFIVIDSTRLGPAFARVRIRPFDLERDALIEAIDTAAAATVEAAMAGLPCGGGAIVAVPRPRLRREAAQSVLREVIDGLRGRVVAWHDPLTGGPISAASGRYGRSGARRAHARAGGQPPEPDNAAVRGALAAIRAAVGHTGLSSLPAPHDRLDGMRVCVQGLGPFGLALVRSALAAGAEVVASDADPVASRRGARLGARIVPPGRIVRLRADVLLPASDSTCLDEEFAARCGARIVCSPLALLSMQPEAEAELRRRGIAYVPGTLAGAGALIEVVRLVMKRARGGKIAWDAAGSDAIGAVEAIGPRVRRFLRDVDRTGLLPSELVRRAVLRRLSRFHGGA